MRDLDLESLRRLFYGEDNISTSDLIHCQARLRYILDILPNVKQLAPTRLWLAMQLQTATGFLIARGVPDDDQPRR